ncbi:MAG: hypothetical protein IT184_16315 [Acidobacteria bacterium]|nr:hypothetical protein [Acidobacteriota bacterium]
MKRPTKVLTLRIHGPRPGRIGVSELIDIAKHAQTAINRQAAAIEGETQTLRPGPPTGKVKVECELELVSLGKGSTVLGFDLAQPQRQLPDVMSISRDAISKVGEAIENAAAGRIGDTDAGVLDSIRNLGHVLNGKVTSVEWVPAMRRRSRSTSRPKQRALLTKDVRDRIEARLEPPRAAHVSKDGVLEMADFKTDDYRCRLRLALEPAIICTFAPELAKKVQDNLRRPVRLEGNATINAYSKRIETLDIVDVHPIDPLTMDAGSFFAHPTFEQLAQQQGIEPLRDASVLAGALPDDFDVDAMVEGIYRQRH